MEDTQKSGDIFWNATYFTIYVVNMLQNALSQDKLLAIDLCNLRLTSASLKLGFAGEAILIYVTFMVFKWATFYQLQLLISKNKQYTNQSGS